MSATYNWAYKPGATNKYGFTVPAGTDNVKPANWCYVALYGNDSTGNGSRQYPYKTITKAWSVSAYADYIILGSGVYREAAPITNNQGLKIIGDGEVTIDISYINYLNTQANTGLFLYNLTVLGSGTSTVFSGSCFNPCGFQDVVFDGSYYFGTGSDTTLTNCIIKNYSATLVFQNFNLSYGIVKNCTFVNCNNIQFVRDAILIDSSIFVSCNFSCSLHNSYAIARYCLFYKCNFKLTDGVASGGVLYPSVPSGYTYYSNINTLISDYNALYSIQSFRGSLIADPLFNNEAIGDFTLSFSSPAKNLSYFGTYVGARSIAYPVKVKATESAGGFEFASAVNLTISDDSMVLTNTALDGQIDTKVIVNSLGREIANLPAYGFNADRNGQYIDSIADLSGATRSAGDTLVVPAPYLVENGAVVYNGSTYIAGTRFTTVSGQTSFTTATGGTLREILEAPQRHTVMARFSDGGAVVTSGTALTTGYYYFVLTGSVTYDIATYTAGAVFKAVDTNAFSGSGTVILAFSTESYQHYEPGTKPTSNNVGDARTGAIIRGNGDPAYVRGGTGITEFNINAKFIQIRYIIRVSNLRP